MRIPWIQEQYYFNIKYFRITSDKFIYNFTFYTMSFFSQRVAQTIFSFILPWSYCLHSNVASFRLYGCLDPLQHDPMYWNMSQFHVILPCSMWNWMNPASLTRSGSQHLSFDGDHLPRPAVQSALHSQEHDHPQMKPAM